MSSGEDWLFLHVIRARGDTAAPRVLIHGIPAASRCRKLRFEHSSGVTCCAQAVHSNSGPFRAPPPLRPKPNELSLQKKAQLMGMRGEVSTLSPRALKDGAGWPDGAGVRAGGEVLPQAPSNPLCRPGGLLFLGRSWLWWLSVPHSQLVSSPFPKRASGCSGVQCLL